MNQIAEKFPKAWKLLSNSLINKHQVGWDSEYLQWVDIYENGVEIPDTFLFGFLILEFFPKYGIEIERKGYCDSFGGVDIKYEVLHIDTMDEYIFDTAEQACEKALGILEGVL